MTLAQPVSAETTAVDDFAEAGVHLFGEVLDPAACAALLKELKAGRDWGEGLFLTEEDRRRSAVPWRQSAPGTQPAGRL